MPTRIEFDPAGIPVHSLTLAEHPEAVAQIVAIYEEAAVEMAWQPGDQITAYPESSIYFGFISEGRVQGAVQLVRGGTSEGLPVLKVWPELAGMAGGGLDVRRDVADVALVALRKEIRGRRHLYWALYAAMWRHCLRERITELWMEVPHEKLESYRGLGWPLSVEGPLRMQWEEPCYPCRVSVRGVGEAMIARARRAGTFFRTIEDEYQAAGAT